MVGEVEQECGVEGSRGQREPNVPFGLARFNANTVTLTLQAMVQERRAGA